MTAVAVPWSLQADPARLDPYVEALRRAGAEPAVLSPAEPPVATPRYAALLLPGGGDVAPERYGQPRDPRTVRVDPALDELELRLAARALTDGTPVLAICRGIQVLNVAAGGDLLQHVDGHQGTRHAVAAAGGLARLDGREVNSSHHQAVGRLAPGFEVLATSPDGVVEAIRRPDHPFALGVQWHPEREPLHPWLFEALVEAARGR